MKKLLVLMLWPVIAQAEFMTGNDLLDKLKSESVTNKAISLGYVMGVFDSHQGISHCAPGNQVTAGQVQDLVRMHLENSPAIRHQTADVIISNLLGKVWPCQAAKRTPGV